MPDLFDLAEIADAKKCEIEYVPDNATIQAKFLIFHARHPDVYTLFTALAEKMRAAGWRRYSAKTIIEQIRWHYDLASGGRDGEWKLNNNYTSRYVPAFGVRWLHGPV